MLDVGALEAPRQPVRSYLRDPGERLGIAMLRCWPRLPRAGRCRGKRQDRSWHSTSSRHSRSEVTSAPTLGRARETRKCGADPQGACKSRKTGSASSAWAQSRYQSARCRLGRAFSSADTFPSSQAWPSSVRQASTVRAEIIAVRTDGRRYNDGWRVLWRNDYRCRNDDHGARRVVTNAAARRPVEA